MEFRRAARWLELVANVGIILAALAMGLTFFAKADLPQSVRSVQPAQDKPAAIRPRPTFPARINLQSVDFHSSRLTLLALISSKCKYCEDSIDFYRRLALTAREKTGVRFVVAAAEPLAQTRDYLERHHLSPGATIQIERGQLGLSATPTLLLVDDNGLVLEGWVGRLDAAAEANVIASIRSRAGA